MKGNAAKKQVCNFLKNRYEIYEIFIIFQNIIKNYILFIVYHNCKKITTDTDLMQL
jgi:hypothetical protein